MTPSSGLAPGIATVPWTVAEPEPAPITIYDEDGSLSPTTTAVGPGEARAANRSGARSRYGRIGTAVSYTHLDVYKRQCQETLKEDGMHAGDAV